MKIYCKSMEKFVEVVAGLVSKGLTFEADADTYVIKLTGGY